MNGVARYVGLAMPVCVLAITGCQSTTYSTNERLKVACDTSPIQVVWSGARTPDSDPCIRRTAQSNSVTVYNHYRFFRIPEGFANINLEVSFAGTYLIEQDVDATTRYYDNAASKGMNWSKPTTYGSGESKLRVISFDLDRNRCHGFVNYAQAASAGYLRRLYGYMCGPQLDEDTAVKFFTSLKIDPYRKQTVLESLGQPELPKAKPLPAAPSPSRPPPQNPNTTLSRNAADRLQELQSLKDKGLVTQTEYEEKRKAIIGDL